MLYNERVFSGDREPSLLTVALVDVNDPWGNDWTDHIWDLKFLSMAQFNDLCAKRHILDDFRSADEIQKLINFYII